MMENKRIFDIKPKNRPKKWAGDPLLWLGAFALAAGLVVAGLFGWERLDKRNGPGGNILGEETQEAEHSGSPLAEEDAEQAPGTADGAGTESQAPSESPATDTTQPQPPPPDPVCQTALAEFEQTKASAESEYNISAAEAQSVYELEVQEATANLALLLNERNAVINTYYAAIEQATNKYNASDETEADYDTYQQEQAAALAVYSGGIEQIESQELFWQENIEDAGKRRILRTNEAGRVRDEKTAAAQGQYQSRTAGKNCSI
jgi:hypothetical protein